MPTPVFPPQPSLPLRYEILPYAPMQGGFGRVWRIKDNSLGREVLFKEIQHKSDNAILLNEIQNLSAARSRHVVEIYDIITDDSGDVAGVIIEYLPGRSYSDFHIQALSKPVDFIKILYQLSIALNDLHSRGIVHRDIKLDNMKESSSGMMKIFDFGISTPASNHYTTNNRGTLIYAAPELHNTGALVTKQVDIYAFGICAWALSSATCPAELATDPPQSTSRAPSIDTVFNGILSKDIVAILDRCLDPDPSARPNAFDLVTVISKDLNRGKHKGLFVNGSQSIYYELSNSQNFLKVGIGTLGTIEVKYNGVNFIVQSATGDVYVNNVPVIPGFILPSSCVITYGNPALGSGRKHVPFFSSHPQVIL